jgi:hypothetical protein
MDELHRWLESLGLAVERRRLLPHGMDGWAFRWKNAVLCVRREDDGRTLVICDVQTDARAGLRCGLSPLVEFTAALADNDIGIERVVGMIRPDERIANGIDPSRLEALYRRALGCPIVERDGNRWVDLPLKDFRTFRAQRAWARSSRQEAAAWSTP